MDKNNYILGSVFAVAAAACWYISMRYYPVRPNPTAVNEAAAPSAAAPATTEGMPQLPSAVQPPSFAAAVTENKGALITRLQNSFIEIDLTNFGGAIRDVALEKYPAAIGSPAPFVMNELHKAPMAALVDLPGMDSRTPYTLVSHTATEVVYRVTWQNELEVTRRYVISPDTVGTTDPYQIRIETTFRNLTNHSVTIPVLQEALGTAAPVSVEDRGMQLTSGYDQNGSVSFIKRSSLESSNGLFGLGVGAHPAVPSEQHPGPITWASVANQFFVSILTPDQPASGLVTRRVKVLNQLSDDNVSAYGITSDAVFSLPPLAAGAKTTLGGELYTGPTEYHRLDNANVFKADQSRVMNFGYFRIFSALLLTLLTWMHGLFSNWGVAIIMTTLLLKLVFMPFTLSASRSAKRMQKLQPQLKALKEKFKDNAQKQQVATMELFKANKVNPLGGCLPMLITLPFFWGFYRMLYSAAELRYAPFLWAKDLSAPDTVGHVLGVPINILPLLLGVTMFLQMQFTPQPTVDNSQAKMMRFMPLLFMFFCYSYSCALSLYYSVNTLLSIVQQMIVNRTTDTEPLAVSSGGKTLKNVTPKRR